MSKPDYDNAAANIFDFIHAALGIDLGGMGGTDKDDDWDTAFTGLGRVAVHAANHPEWKPDWHWKNWIDNLPEDEA